MAPNEENNGRGGPLGWAAAVYLIGVLGGGTLAIILREVCGLTNTTIEGVLGGAVISEAIIIRMVVKENHRLRVEKAILEDTVGQQRRWTTEIARTLGGEG